MLLLLLSVLSVMVRGCWTAVSVKPQVGCHVIDVTPKAISNVSLVMVQVFISHGRHALSAVEAVTLWGATAKLLVLVDRAKAKDILNNSTVNDVHVLAG